MISLDKQAHFLGGYALAVTVGFFSPWVGLAAAVVAGAAKEGYDYKHPTTHTADLKDLAATVLGGILGFLFVTFAPLSGF